jgi:hypothetical protein
MLDYAEVPSTVLRDNAPGKGSVEIEVNIHIASTAIVVVTTVVGHIGSMVLRVYVCS